MICWTLNKEYFMYVVADQYFMYIRTNNNNRRLVTLAEQRTMYMYICNYAWFYHIRWPGTCVHSDLGCAEVGCVPTLFSMMV